MVAALHHVSHAHLADPSAEVHCDVLIATDDGVETDLGPGDSYRIDPGMMRAMPGEMR